MEDCSHSGWDAQQSELHTTIGFSPIAYDRDPDFDNPRLDLAGGDFTIDFEDPLPWGELMGRSGSLEE